MISKIDSFVKTRPIEVLLFNGVNLLDVSGPVQAFSEAQVNGRKRYSVRYVSVDGKPIMTQCGLKLVPEGRLSATNKSDDLIVPGGIGVNALLQDQVVLDIIVNRASNVRGGRIISICSGALILAKSGILDGLTATTHWSRLEETHEYENVHWDLDRITTTNERIFTSAGVTTGIDLALSIIRKDCGSSSALEVARELVVQLRRVGGQSQYAIHLAGQFSNDDKLTRLIENVVSRPELDWSLNSLAKSAGMNSRTLTRRFKRELNSTPARFVEHVRVDHARELILANLPLKQVAVDSGFGDLQRMRRAFKRRFGINVSDYVSIFG